MCKDHFTGIFSKFKDFQIISIDVACFYHMTCWIAQFLDKNGKRRRETLI